MACHGTYVRITMVCHGRPRECHGHPRECHGRPWAPVATHTHPWQCHVVTHGNATWAPMATHGNAMGVRGNPWSSMAIPRVTFIPRASIGMPWLQSIVTHGLTPRRATTVNHGDAMITHGPAIGVRGNPWSSASTRHGMPWHVQLMSTAPNFLGYAKH